MAWPVVSQALRCPPIPETSLEVDSVDFWGDWRDVGDGAVRAAPVSGERGEPQPDRGGREGRAGSRVGSGPCNPGR